MASNDIAELVITEEHRARMPEWIQTWSDIGSSTEPADFEAAERGVRGCYRAANLPQPKMVLRVGSPMGAILGGPIAVVLLELTKRIAKCLPTSYTHTSIDRAVDLTVDANHIYASVGVFPVLSREAIAVSYTAQASIRAPDGPRHEDVQRAYHTTLGAITEQCLPQLVDTLTEAVKAIPALADNAVFTISAVADNPVNRATDALARAGSDLLQMEMAIRRQSSDMRREVTAAIMAALENGKFKAPVRDAIHAVLETRVYRSIPGRESEINQAAQGAFNISVAPWTAEAEEQFDNAVFDSIMVAVDTAKLQLSRGTSDDTSSAIDVGVDGRVYLAMMAVPLPVGAFFNDVQTLPAEAMQEAVEDGVTTFAPLSDMRCFRDSGYDLTLFSDAVLVLSANPVSSTIRDVTMPFVHLENGAAGLLPGHSGAFAEVSRAFTVDAVQYGLDLLIPKRVLHLVYGGWMRIADTFSGWFPVSWFRFLGVDTAVSYYDQTKHHVTIGVEYAVSAAAHMATEGDSYGPFLFHRSRSPDRHISDAVRDQIGSAVSAIASAVGGMRLDDVVEAASEGRKSDEDHGAAVIAKYGADSPMTQAVTNTEARNVIGDVVNPSPILYSQVTDGAYPGVYQVVMRAMRGVFDQVSNKVMEYAALSSGQYRGGNMWAHWYAYVTFLRDVCGWKHPSLEAFAQDELAARNASWVWYHGEVAVIADRPSAIHRDEEGRLHCDDGMAVSYRDGWGVWSIHGQTVDKQVVMAPETLTVAQINAERSEEIRRIMIERFGWERYLLEAGAKCLDRRHNDMDAQEEVLYSLEREHGDPLTRLIVVDPSTGRKYSLGVPAETQTCEAAQTYLSHGLSARCTHRS